MTLRLSIKLYIVSNNVFNSVDTLNNAQFKFLVSDKMLNVQ